MEIKVKEKKLVMFAYFIAITTSMLAVLDSAPVPSLLNKIKYIYILFALFFCIYDGVIFWNRKFAISFCLLLIHTVILGLIFINPRLEVLTQNHFRQLIMTYIFVFVTVVYVYKNRCLTEFLQCSYVALTIQTMYGAITHFQDFVNPLYFFNVFSRYGRFRAAFGYGDVNYCGNYCVYSILLAIWIRKELKSSGKELPIWSCILSYFFLFIQICMLFSTASRSGLLSLVLFGAVLLICDYSYVIKNNWKVIAPLIVFVILVFAVIANLTGILSDIWVDSNREGNFSINYPVFLEYGNYLWGMGYVDNSGFLEMVYGYETTAMDVYYLYIAYASGYAGAILIFSQMIYTFINLFVYRKRKNGNYSLALYIMMLFYSVWQVNYMNYRYYTGIIHMVIIFVFLCQADEQKNTLWISLRKG